VAYWEIRNIASELVHSLCYGIILIKSKVIEIYNRAQFFFSHSSMAVQIRTAADSEVSPAAGILNNRFSFLDVGATRCSWKSSCVSGIHKGFTAEVRSELPERSFM